MRDSSQSSSIMQSSGSHTPPPLPPANAACPVLDNPKVDSSAAKVCPVVSTKSPHTAPVEQLKDVTLVDRTRAALCRGGFASILTTMVTGAIWHPVVTVMVRQQFSGAVEGATKYNGVTDAVRGIWREGARSFYRGLGPRLMQSPLAAIQWTTYEMFRDVVSHRKNSNWDAAKYAALFVASRTLVTTAKCPFEVVKERMQVEGSLKGMPKRQSAWKNMRLLVSLDGYRGLFNGLSVNIMRDIPVALLMMSGNDFYTHLIASGTPVGFWDRYFREDRNMRAKGQVRSPWKDMLAGALSGLTASLLTQPIDVAKTIIQTQSMSRLLPDSPKPKYRGLWDVLMQTRRQHGVKFWFTGFTARAAHISLGGSVYLMLYRRLQRALTVGLMPEKKL